MLPANNLNLFAFFSLNSLKKFDSATY